MARACTSFSRFHCAGRKLPDLPILLSFFFLCVCEGVFLIFIILVVLKLCLITYSENTVLRLFPEGAELFTGPCPVWTRTCICTYTHQGPRAEPPGPSPVPTHLTNCTSEVGGLSLQPLLLGISDPHKPGRKWCDDGKIWIQPSIFQKNLWGGMAPRCLYTRWGFLRFSSENWVRFWGLEIQMRAFLVFTSLQCTLNLAHIASHITSQLFQKMENAFQPGNLYLCLGISHTQ